MTTYATTDELKAYLGIDIADTSKDTLLNIYLNSAERYINGYFSVDTLLTANYTERLKIDPCSRDDNRGYVFYLRKRPVTSIVSLNGNTYTGTIETDYIIENQRKVTFKQISQYLTGFWWDTVTIVYTAGFSSVPYDIKLAEIMIASGFYATAGTNQVYESYQIGDEKVVFKSSAEQDAVWKLLKPYRVFY